MITETLMGTNFNFKNPWNNTEDNLQKVKDAAVWLGLNLSLNDMEFMAAFISLNETLIESKMKGEISNKEIISNLEIPEKKEYRTYYEVWGPATATEKYRTKWESYDEDWVKDSLLYHWREGLWDYYEGSYDGYDLDNFDADNFEVVDVHSINESKKSVLSKLVVENTEDLIETLDKDTLIELKNLINQKLSSF